MLRMITLLSVALTALPAATEPTRPAAAPPKSPLKIATDVPQGRPTLAQVNQGDYGFNLVLTNVGKDPLVLWPFATIQVLDPAGKPVRPSMNLGRFGLRRGNSVLEGITFVTLKPGQAHRIEVNLARYASDPMAIKGWQLPGPGAYKVVVTYQYNRADVKRVLGKGAADIDNPAHAWNKALEVKESVEVPVPVK